MDQRTTMRSLAMTNMSDSLMGIAAVAETKIKNQTINIKNEKMKNKCSKRKKNINTKEKQ